MAIHSSQLNNSIVGKMAETTVSGKRRLLLIEGIYNHEKDYSDNLTACLLFGTPLQGVKVVWDNGDKAAFLQNVYSKKGSLHFLNLVDENTDRHDR